jgi:hypothetical protein
MLFEAPHWSMRRFVRPEMTRWNFETSPRCWGRAGWVGGRDLTEPTATKWYVISL